MQDQELIGFAQTLVRTQGYSRQEATVANAVVAEMQRLHFDESYIDDCGNALVSQQRNRSRLQGLLQRPQNCPT